MIEQGGSKARFFEKKRAKNVYELRALAVGLPLIGTEGGD